jgi:mannose-6-phosphate isomerase-like protein (cupin superfamily)
VNVASLGSVGAFTTKDGSTIRELHHTAAQSLAEAELAPGQATQRHYHAATEEIYFIETGRGVMEVDGARRDVEPGDAVLIPAGAWHEIRAADEPLRFLCCCVPPYRDDDTFFE